jgi:hypothetical protein
MTNYKIVNGSMVQLNEAEVSVLTLREAEWIDSEHDRLSSENRSERNRLLSETDWMALSDNTMTPEWASYRQALRDITAQEGFPYDVTWPTKPAF